VKRTEAEVSADLADGYVTAWPVEGARG